MMMMSDLDYFPLKLAKGEHFCNREAERLALHRNIDLVRHTVLVSPRRYGKSSLVYKTAAEIVLPFEAIDLFLAHDDKAVTKRILTGIAAILSQLLTPTTKAIASLSQFFSSFKVGVNASGFHLEISHERGVVEPVDQIFDALRALAAYAAHKKRKVILFIDEFQDIASATSSKAIQGAIRHVAQDTQWLIFIFSGSNRHLLLEIFDDKKMPLYMLCDKIFLDRMLMEDYRPHLQKVAQKRWGCALAIEVIQRILTFVELHPFYVNLLCSEIWRHDLPPTLERVSVAWQVCHENEERRVIAELEKLTNNQQDLLKALALSPTAEPTGKHFLKEVGLSLSSVRLGIKTLLEKDMIFKVQKEDPQLSLFKKGQFRVLDPLIAFTLRQYS